MNRNFPGTPPAAVKFFRIGGEESSRQLEWEQGQLWYREVPSASGTLHQSPWRAFREPAGSAWSRLHAALEEVGYWRWPKEFPGPGSTEDCQWRIGLRWGAQARTCSGSKAVPTGFKLLEDLLLGLLSEESKAYPEAFKLRCEWPGGEEHFGWDGRHLAFASYQPWPRIVEGLHIPAGAWNNIAPFLEAESASGLARTGAEGECFVLEPLFPNAVANILPSSREVPAGVRHELRRSLKEFLPASSRMEGVPGVGVQSAY